MRSAQVTILLSKHYCKTEIGIGFGMIVKWDTNSLCVCHWSLTNINYNNAEGCICILEYGRKRLFKIFCFWLPFTNYWSFFSCFDRLLLNFRQHFSSNWLLYSFMSRLSIRFPNKNLANLYLIYLKIVAFFFNILDNLQVFQSCRKLIIDYR
jgi:hypothetical protein